MSSKDTTVKSGEHGLVEYFELGGKGEPHLLNINDTGDLDFGEPAGELCLDDFGGTLADALRGPDDGFGEPSLDDFGELFVENALGIFGCNFFEELGLDDFAEPEPSTELDLNGLTNLPGSVGFLLKVDDGIFFGVLGLDGLVEPDFSETGLEPDSAEHGLTNLLEVELSLSADDGLSFSLPNIFANYYSTGSQL